MTKRATTLRSFGDVRSVEKVSDLWKMLLRIKVPVVGSLGRIRPGEIWAFFRPIGIPEKENKMANETAWLENLARRIETAARIPNNKAKLFAIADDVRRYKDKKHDGVDLFEGIEHLEMR
jgi:hypothetical protein